MNDSQSDSQSEMNLLDSVTKTYVTSDSPQDRLIKTLAVRAFSPFIHPGGSALEFGCCDGFMTSLLAPLVSSLEVVDGSQVFIDMAKERVPSKVEFTYSLFEEYEPARTFDYIFATFVLEHVNDAVGLLKKAGSLLSEKGLLFVVVPNARALSRQLARHMGLLDSLYALTPNDINHGHRRVYDRTLLNLDMDRAGLVQVSQGGLLLKLLADFQMDKMIETGILGDPQLEGLYKMGLEYPDLAGSLFSVCRNKAS
ncbi:class I SAM-dependent methyltransferase [Lignipirellula cremea]|uniref:Trans-aconitate 2-methyltransferase n=1 Tax=Lignipirellula cremea TaxID=2528010 RepID=A0A518DY96_9BACT|nr:class I SAM-dependent methyltransferase [Lignipirellula cremea]QDU96817.1 trans-aconitate 2-methyltransferase [Lignipirellula cremea]